MAVTFAQDISRAIDPPVDQIGFTQEITRRLGASINDAVLTLTGAPTGLTGTLTIGVVTTDGSVYVQLPTTTGIQESPAGTGRYQATIPQPDVGRYLAVWSDGELAVTAPFAIIGDPSDITLTPAPTTCDIGDIIQAVALFHSNTEPFDPDTIQADVTQPDGTQTTVSYPTDPELIRDTTGRYLLNITITAQGHWYYRIYSTGSLEAAAKGSTYATDDTPISTWAPPIHTTG